MRARIIGVGQPLAGDDAAGLAAIAAIREIGAPDVSELAGVIEPSAIVPLLIDGADPVIVIDAAMGGGRPGRVLAFAPRTPAKRGPRMLSTHGLGVLEAIELARTLHPESVAKRITVLAITVSRRNRSGEKLSPTVARAVRTAAAKAIKLVRGQTK